MHTHLRKLNDTRDLTVAFGDPDPRGWNVESIDGQHIGHVNDLIVDTDTMKARYLDVAVNPDLVREHDRHLFVPTEAVRIGDRERDERRIAVPLSPDRAMAAARPADALLTTNPADDEWPAAQSDVCDVRVTRGGTHG